MPIPQIDINKINAQNNQIIQQEENRLKYKKQNEQQFSVQITKDYFYIDNNTSADENCFPIKQVEIIDNKVLSNQVLSSITSKYENQCLTQKKVVNLLNEINNKYIKEGYITTQSYLKEQDLSTQILKIHIQEGKIENIVINNAPSTEVVQTFPHYKDKILNLRDIEMGLEHFNRLYTTSTTLDLQEGSKVGYSLINIHKEQDKKIFTSLSVNNNGSQSTGKNTGDLQLYLENILNLNTQFIIGLSGTLKRLDEKRTIGRSYTWNIPYGYYLFTAGYREFLYRSTITGENATYVSSGTNSTYFYNLDYTFFRNDTTIFKANLGLDIKQNVNFIANQVLTTSSNKLTVANLGISGSTSFHKTFLSGSLTLKRGLTWFDAFTNKDDLYKKAQFTALNLYLSASTDIMLGELPLTLNNVLSAQYSNDKLYSTELFSIGGLYTVRGFEYMNYSGEIGAYLRNDLSYTTAKKVWGQDAVLTPFVGVDFGVVEYDADIYKYMVGAALGLKVKTKYLSMEFTLGVPLYAYDPIAEEKTTFSFSFTYHY